MRRVTKFANLQSVNHVGFLAFFSSLRCFCASSPPSKEDHVPIDAKAYSSIGDYVGDQTVGGVVLR